jgi:hypothetical protein
MMVFPFESDDSFVELIVVVPPSGEVEDHIVVMMFLLYEFGYFIDIVAIKPLDSICWKRHSNYAWAYIG